MERCIGVRRHGCHPRGRPLIPEQAEIPEVSIVVPVYGGARLTRDCLRSIAAHSDGFRYEIVVVDDASPDEETKRLLVELDETGGVTVIRRTENGGFAKACNRGIEGAGAERVLLLNNDTEVQAGWLGPLMAALDHDDVGAAGSLLLYPGGRLIQHAGVATTRRRGEFRIFHLGQYWRESELASVREDRDVPAVTAACILVRKSALPGGVRFEEGYRNGYEDVDLCLRLGASGWKVRYCGASRVIHHESVSQGRFTQETANRALFLGRWSKATEFFDPSEGAWELSDRRARREYILGPSPARAARVAHLAAERGFSEEARLWDELALGRWLPWHRIDDRRRWEIHDLLGLTDLRVRGAGVRS